MEDNQIRRLPVLQNGELVGILSQADIAERTSRRVIGDLVHEISHPLVKRTQLASEL